MRVLTSQLAGGDSNADRVLVTDNAVLVLDGATAFEPVSVDPGDYAETLGQAVASRIEDDPALAISDAVAFGISIATRAFDLRPGQSPSSTIAVLRVHNEIADLYVLGDSPIYYGTAATTQVLRDHRIAEIATHQRATYVNSLRAGLGYTADHWHTLAALQRVQREHRNRSNGYWIAEAEPMAAHYGFSTTIDSSSAQWAILGTDGATDLVATIAPAQWSTIAAYDQVELDELLNYVHSWERDIDPTGQAFPRAKRHDDKTLAIVPQIF